MSNNSNVSPVKNKMSDENLTIVKRKNFKIKKIQIFGKRVNLKVTKLKNQTETLTPQPRKTNFNQKTKKQNKSKK